MDKTLMDRYIKEAMHMYQIGKERNPVYKTQVKASKERKPVAIAKSEIEPIAIAKSEIEPIAIAASVGNENKESEYSTDLSAIGGLMVNVRAIRELYPIKGAVVTVFTGDEDNMNIVAEGVTDENGKSPLFTLPAPPKSLSIVSDAKAIPFAVYNVATQAEGYVKNINKDVSIFDGVTSIQNVNLMLEAVTNCEDGNCNGITQVPNEEQ